MNIYICIRDIFDEKYSFFSLQEVEVCTCQNITTPPPPPPPPPPTPPPTPPTCPPCPEGTTLVENPTKVCSSIPQIIQDSIPSATPHNPIDVDPHSFIPWQVSINLRNSAYGRLSYKPFCGGVLLDHKTVLTAAQCFFGDEDCCTPKNSIDENCQSLLFNITTNDFEGVRVICNGKYYRYADVFVTAGATTLYKDVIDAIGCSSNAFDALPACKQDPNIQVNKKIIVLYLPKIQHYNVLLFRQVMLKKSFGILSIHILMVG